MLVRVRTCHLSKVSRRTVSGGRRLPGRPSKGTRRFRCSPLSAVRGIVYLVGRFQYGDRSPRLLDSLFRRLVERLFVRRPVTAMIATLLVHVVFSGNVVGPSPSSSRCSSASINCGRHFRAVAWAEEGRASDRSGPARWLVDGGCDRLFDRRGRGRWRPPARCSCTIHPPIR
jgi:hypothetical protein